MTFSCPVYTKIPGATPHTGTAPIRLLMAFVTLFRNSKSADKRQVLIICAVWAKKAASGDQLTPDRDCEVICQGVADSRGTSKAAAQQRRVSMAGGVKWEITNWRQVASAFAKWA